MTRTAALDGQAAARLVAAALPPCLAAAGARARIAALAPRLPGGSLGQIVEIRLDGRGETVDVSLCWRPEGLGDLARAARADPDLAPLAPVLSWAARRGRPRSLWLEWDLPEGAEPGTGGPSLFLAPAAAPFALTEALAVLGRPTLAPILQETLSRLPGEASLRQLGLMLSRPMPVLRLVLDLANPFAAETVLTKLRPDLLPVLRALRRLPGFADAPRLDLDLGPSGIGPRLSLERPAASLSAPALAAALDEIAAAGVIAAGAGAALRPLLDWSGLGPGESFGLSHLKASAAPAMEGEAGPVEVKAYVGLIALPPTPVPPLPASVPA